MKKRTITKLIVQGVAGAFGVLGLMWIFFGFLFAVTSIRQSDRFSMFYMASDLLLFGGICFAIAWQNLRHFGRKSIQYVAGLVAFSVYVGLITLMEPFMELYPSATSLIPLLLAYLLYRVLSRKLIQLTETQSSQPEVGPISSETAPSATPDGSST